MNASRFDEPDSHVFVDFEKGETLMVSSSDHTANKEELGWLVNSVLASAAVLRISGRTVLQVEVGTRKICEELAAELMSLEQFGGDDDMMALRVSATQIFIVLDPTDAPAEELDSDPE